MEFILIYVFIAAIVGLIGSDRAIGFWGVFMWSLLLSPVIGLFIAALAKSKQKADLEWNAMQSIINQNKVAAQPTVINQKSVADELNKLKQLKEDGTIDEAEYQKMKNKLIASFD